MSLSAPTTAAAAAAAAVAKTSVAEALSAVKTKIQASAERLGRPAPRLVAVSKTKPVSMLMEAFEAGQRHFGENYVQELVEKAPNMPRYVKWHFIGNLQSNKVKHIVSIPNLYMVESVHSVKIANTLNRLLPDTREEKLRVMVQVNTSGEESKSGVEPSGCLELVEHVMANCTKLELVGLMTIGRLGDVSPECFQLLAKCRDDVMEKHATSFQDGLELSMGMSGDFELAMAHGSTNVRVGSTIFGARSYPAKAAPAPPASADASAVPTPPAEEQQQKEQESTNSK
ncbi:Pyridoxal phosphate homeostasis protein (PLP homeostasis protein) (Proline synthase co-transcribed bacterial homolog protein) (Pyridoxal phosphate-binding protein) [Durusdinium trenchii]|uniref:Pyridoxal phosphate homeostasis protein n=1 Tax=Durusdinium trenchii TaxID=1381693 RepID=A0ABP0H7F5_9DINO